MEIYPSILPSNINVEITQLDRGSWIATLRSNGAKYNKLCMSLWKTSLSPTYPV